MKDRKVCESTLHLAESLSKIPQGPYKRPIAADTLRSMIKHTAFKEAVYISIYREALK